MATVKENLIAARALIDTPEKWEAAGKSWSVAIFIATGGWDGYSEAEQAFASHPAQLSGHSSVLDRFDRAIAAQDGA